MREQSNARRRRRRKLYERRIRMAAKLILVVGGCCLFLFLIGRTVVKIAQPRLESGGDYVPVQEAGNLVWLLADTAAGEEGAPEADADAILSELQTMDAGGWLTYGQAVKMMEMLPDCKAALSGGAYQKKERIEAADWYTWFDEARAVYDPKGRIKNIPVTILGVGGDVKGNDGKDLMEGELVTTERKWPFFAERFSQDALLYRPVTAVGRDDGLYAVRSMGEENGFRLSNVWVMGIDREQVNCFWNNYEIRLAAHEMESQDGKKETRTMEELLSRLEGTKDEIADLTFANGAVTDIDLKSDKVSGRLLRIDDGGAEIEGQGFFPFSDSLKIYQLYGRMKRLYTTDLCIGYAFTDFVIDKGVIEAALVPKEEKMEYIRVLVKTSGYGSAYHDSIELTADCDCEVITGEYGSMVSRKLKAGEKLTLTRDSELFTGERVWVKPEILTGHITLENVERSQGTPAYRGSFEFMKSRDGIVAVNEVLLEEYLYAVVPSEMPASYPAEALKSQAVCARTYAYAKMRHAGLPSYGAHVDDSAGFQVYNNIMEAAEANRAVRETKGQALYYGDDLAETYYYSTSCGYGTDAGVWLNGSAEKYPYLMAQSIDSANMDTTLTVLQNAGILTPSEGGELFAAENGKEEGGGGTQEEVLAAMAPVADQAKLMQQEAFFGAFMAEGKEAAYEKDEAWFRWNYEVQALDTDVINLAAARRYEANTDGVLTRQADGSFTSVKPVPTGRIKDITVVKRGPGGVASELLIEGENTVLLIKTEHNIRYVLCDGKTKVIRKDGSEANAASMVPSAFFTISTLKQDGFVVGYTLTGGGFGHGVGLSQNGAKNMAAGGRNADEILSFFYKGCNIRNIYGVKEGL